MVLVAGVWIRAPWLPRAALAAGVLALLGLAAANPDALIARTNIHQNRTVDLDYLSDLSPDAASAVAKYARDNAQPCALERMRWELDQRDDWRQWNLGRERARQVLRDAPGDTSCP